jgi:hypothetical protein
MRLISESAAANKWGLGEFGNETRWIMRVLNGIIIGFLLLATCGSYAQKPDVSTTDSVRAKSLIDFKSFKIDEQQTEGKQAINLEKQRAFRCSFLTLDNLAKVAGGVNQAEALDCLNTLLVRLDESVIHLIPVPSNHSHTYKNTIFRADKAYLHRLRKYDLERRNYFTYIV